MDAAPHATAAMTAMHAVGAAAATTATAKAPPPSPPPPHAAADATASSTARSSALARSKSRGSFVSARDAAFWLAVAAASTSASSVSSGSFSSAGSSFSRTSSLFSIDPMDATASTSDFVAGDAGNGSNSKNKSGSHGQGDGSGDAASAGRRLGLWIDMEAVNGDDSSDSDLEAEEKEQHQASDDGQPPMHTEAPQPRPPLPQQQQQPQPSPSSPTTRATAARSRGSAWRITSPPPPAGGLRVPTRIRTRRRSQSSAVSIPTGNGGGRRDARALAATATSPPLAPLSSSLPPPPLVTITTAPSPSLSPSPSQTAVSVEDASLFPIAVEEVFENQRYQIVLGWGSKGHLLPLDPGKYQRIVRTDGRPVDAVNSATFPDVELPEPSRPHWQQQQEGRPQSRWEWISPWHLEYAAPPSGSSADPDGWCYASSFHQFTRVSSACSRSRSRSKSTSSSLASPPASPSSPSSPFSSPWGRHSEGLVLESPLASSPSVSSWGRRRAKLYVRRRKWIRYRHLRPASGSSVSAFDDAFLDSMCGWLRKLGHVRKNWKQRYFVLDKSILRYYADENMTRLKGEVLLFHPAARVHYVDIHVANGRDHTFAIQTGPEYTLLLQADRLSDRENWMYCIEDALLCRDSYKQDPDKTKDMRESVTRRRRISAESMLFSGSGGGNGTGVSMALESVNPLNMWMLHSRGMVRKNPLTMRVLVASDEYLSTKEMRQQLVAFVLKFKKKYAAGTTPIVGLPINISSSNTTSNTPSSWVVNSPISTTMDSVRHGRRGSICMPVGGSDRSTGTISRYQRRRSSSLDGEGLSDDPRTSSSHSDTSQASLSNLMDLQDARSLHALKSYRFFIERSIGMLMDHLRNLPFVNASVEVTSPGVQATSVAQPGEIDWEMAKKAALYKLERQAFVPLQEVIYSLLEATVSAVSLSHFERNRHLLATRSQSFFEIPASHQSPSEWRSATALLESMDNYSLPSEKASILLSVATCIYETYGSEHSVDAQMMAADDFLPIFIFILTRAELRNVVVSRHLISESMISDVVIGETGYYATMLEASVGYIASFGSNDCDSGAVIV